LGLIIIIIGIDASNIRQGGGITHLKEILSELDKTELNIPKVVVWCNSIVCAMLPNYPWLKKYPVNYLDLGLIRRIYWQTFILKRSAKINECDILLILGGMYLGTFKPFVVICQNLIPFEPSALFQRWWSFFTLKMLLLRVLHSFTFAKSQGIIFLSKYSQNKVLSLLLNFKGKVKIITHGYSQNFLISPDSEVGISRFTTKLQIDLIYVSNIAAYKHQAEVLQAICLLRKRGYDLKISFIGPAHGSAAISLKDSMDRLDPYSQWSAYLGEVPYEQLPDYYKNADIGIFASSCEAFGIILLEKMASGLPIVCSNLSSMPEILEDGGLYFNPRNPIDIANSIERYLISPELKIEKVLRVHELIKKYSWGDCSQSTFQFLSQIALEYKK
jgi:glycosyltransferase involved in cell wall biosynthesis